MHGSVWEQMWRDRKPTPGRHNWVDEPPTDALPSRGPARPRPTPYVRESRVSQQPPITTGIRLPHAAGLSYTARQVAKAYNAPVDSYDGTGQKIGIVELGGGF